MKNKKHKVMVLTPRFPYPVIGGDRLRIFELCKELSKTYSLTLVSLCETQDEVDMSVPQDGVFDEIHRVLLTKKKSYFNCALALFAKKPLQVAYYQSSEFSNLVKSLSSNHDVILSHLIRVADYAKDLPNKKVLEMTDAISLNYTRFSENKNSSGFKGLVYRLERDRLNNYEKEISKCFDLNFLVSQVDKDFLFDRGSSDYDRTLVCSNGVDISKFTYNFSLGKQELVFIGNMYSAQNFDAAMWFAQNVLPQLRHKLDIKFKVVGRIREEDKNRLTRMEGVIVTGAVDDVSSHVRGAIAGICSVRLAAGVQNKILEYMALGIPSITTRTGLEGLESVPGKDILLADTPDEFIKHISKLYHDPEFARTLSENAYSYIQSNHSWSGKLKPAIKAIDNLF
ncbi:glycosyltransferase family 4 protein [Vibrio diabolicus]|uniref:glycosyltransferase family 4 protein n=1 Tax=Vibrio diabolicus TaxID=50719 RepID=UPI0024945826|nr:glycosyltransferase family 4 protein [Vibrio diabolicus]